MMRRVKRDDGFTLIEVMIGMVILTIVSLGLMSLTVSTIRGSTFSRQMTTATTLAQDRIEQIKRLSYVNANTVAPTENYGTITNFPGFRRETLVENDTPAPNVKTVTVSVSWGSGTHTVTSKTILAQ
jgi:type IV pilus assembly protein PilV